MGLKIRGEAMGTQRRSRQQNIKQHLFIIVGIVVTIFVLIVFTLAVSKFSWDWTGFTSVIGPTLHPNEQYRPAKTLWDVLQLLIVPIILAIGGFLLNQIQKERDEKAAKEREKLERENREDNQHEAALQAYIDKMSELLLEKHLGELKPENEEVRKIARVRTLTVLRGLDRVRKGSVLQFLYESRLIEKGKSIIDLNGADLSNADLYEANLQEAGLGKAILNGSNLSRANLNGADLSEAKLREANLSEANSSRANLCKVDLRRAFLRGGLLSGTILTGADLSEANLSRADLSEADLSGEDSLDEELDPFLGDRAANLSGANLIEADLHGANLSWTNLSRADLRGANFRQADPFHLSYSGVYEDDYEQLPANLRNTYLIEANLTGANVTSEQLHQAKSLQGAIMPDGSTHP
jgi:uncharacterized protein YjbI with pentapeptide repeats